MKNENEIEALANEIIVYTLGKDVTDVVGYSPKNFEFVVNCLLKAQALKSQPAPSMSDNELLKLARDKCAEFYNRPDNSHVMGFQHGWRACEAHTKPAPEPAGSLPSEEKEESFCGYCGQRFSVGEVGWKDLQDHITNCEYHPVSKLTKKVKDLEYELANTPHERTGKWPTKIESHHAMLRSFHVQKKFSDSICYDSAWRACYEYLSAFSAPLSPSEKEIFEAGFRTGLKENNGQV